MATLLSPGVAVTTQDLSQVTTASGDSAACFCGDFTKGPVNVPTLVTSVAELKDIFGSPTKANYNQWYQAYNFLQYSGEIYVVRAADLNGTPKETSVTYNSNEFVGSYAESLTKASIFKSGNSIVSLENSNFEVGQNLKFGEDPAVFKIQSVKDELLQTPNPDYQALTDLEVTIDGDSFEAGETINYSFTSSGTVTVAANPTSNVEIDTGAQTIKFLKAGNVEITFEATEQGKRTKKLKGSFEVQKVQSPTRPTVATSEVSWNSTAEFSVEHEDSTTLKASIKDDDGTKGTVNVE